jgi:hypothetical protein
MRAGGERAVALVQVEPLQRQELGASALAQARVADRAQAEPATEALLALARATRQRRQPPGRAADQRHHAVGFTVVDGAQDDGRRR